MRLHEPNEPVLGVDLICHLHGEKLVVVVLVALRAVRLAAHRDDLIDLPTLAERAKEPEFVPDDSATQLNVGIVPILQLLRRDDVHILADVVRLEALARVGVIGGAGEIVPARLDERVQGQTVVRGIRRVAPDADHRFVHRGIIDVVAARVIRRRHRNDVLDRMPGIAKLPQRIEARRIRESGSPDVDTVCRHPRARRLHQDRAVAASTRGEQLQGLPGQLRGISGRGDVHQWRGSRHGDRLLQGPDTQRRIHASRESSRQADVFTPERPESG